MAGLLDDVKVALRRPWTRASARARRRGAAHRRPEPLNGRPRILLTTSFVEDHRALVEQVKLTSAAVTVRVMREEEYPAVRSVVVAAFDGEEGVGDLVDALRGSWAWDPALSFVAEVDGQLVGHVMLTRAWLDAPQRLVDVLVLGPLGVLSDRRHEGVGSALVRHALDAAADATMVLLEGLPGYYPRFGFRPAGQLGVRAPSLRIPPAAFQALPLGGYEPWMTGTLVYPDVVWQLDAVGLRDG